MYRLEIKLYYWIRDKYRVIISPDPKAIGREVFESSGELPGDTEFSLFVLEEDEGDAGFWVELGNDRYRLRELDSRGLSVIAGRGMTDGQVSGKFFLVLGEDGGITAVPTDAPVAASLRSRYVYELSVWSNGGSARGTRKHIPGHRYLAGENVLVYLGQQVRVNGDLVYLYATGNEVGDRTRLSEVFRDISTMTDLMSKGGVKNFSLGNGGRNGEILVHRSPTMSVMMPVGGTPLIDDRLESMPMILGGWVNKFLANREDRPNFLVEVLYRAYTLLGMGRRRCSAPMDPGTVEAIIRELSDITYWQVLSAWNESVDGHSTVREYIESRTVMTPDELRGFYSMAIRGYYEDFYGAPSTVISSLLSRLSIDEGAILERTLDRLARIDPGSMEFKGEVLENLDRFPNIAGFSRGHSATYHRRTDTLAGLQLPLANSKLIVKTLHEALRGDPGDPEWKSRFDVARIRLSGRGSKVTVRKGSYIHVDLVTLAPKDPSARERFLEEVWRIKESSLYLFYKE